MARPSTHLSDNPVNQDLAFLTLGIVVESIKRENKLKTITGNNCRSAGVVLCFVAAMLGLHPGPSPLPTCAQDSSKAANSTGSDVGTAYVSVVDKSGKTVEDLKRENFSIQAKGVPLEILEVSRSRNAPILVGTMVDLSGSANGEYRRDFLQVLDSFFARNVGESENSALMAFAIKTYRVTGMTGSVVELRAGLKKIGEGQPVGPTALYDSLDTASESLFQGVRGRRMLLVLSDFQDNASHRRLETIAAQLKDRGVAVFPLVPVDLSSQRLRATKEGARNAKQIAEETGGVASSFTTPAEMEAALLKIQALWDNSYFLRYRWSSSLGKNAKPMVRIAGHSTEFVTVQLSPPETQ